MTLHTRPDAPAPAGRDPEIPAAARAWVVAILVLLVVPGVIGFDFWPLTGWRMYSVSATESRIEWGVEAITPHGPVDLAWPEYPLAYRVAAWPLAEFESLSDDRREGRCLAMLEGVRAALPEATAVAVTRDRRTLNDEGTFSTERVRVHRCGSP